VTEVWATNYQGAGDLFGSLAIGVWGEAAPADLPADVGRGRGLGPGGQRGAPLGPQQQQHRLVDRMRRG
jgi:hypothetical protein